MGMFRSRLVWKLVLSHMVVVGVLLGVLLVVMWLAGPVVFQRHLLGAETSMPGMGGGGPGSGPGSGSGMGGGMLADFLAALNEALLWGGIIAGLVAVGVSGWVSWRIVQPVRAVQAAARRIAQGHYDERAPVKRGMPDELDELAVDFNAMAERLAETEARRQALIGDIAHDLRTPLTTISGTMEALIDGVLPATPETFAEVGRDAQRLQRLVDDLQVLSRVEGGAVRLDVTDVAAEGLVRDAVQRLEQQFVEKGVALLTDPMAAGLSVRADVGQTERVLLNLIGNALRYTPSGGWVRVSAAAEGAQVRFMVDDSGIGLTPEQQALVFERFYRADEARGSGGSGLGLTIAQKLVLAQGGAIGVDSAGLGQGSQFWFRLPRAG